MENLGIRGKMESFEKFYDSVLKTFNHSFPIVVKAENCIIYYNRFGIFDALTHILEEILNEDTT